MANYLPAYLTLIRLLRAAKEAASSNSDAYEQIVQCIQEDHLASAKTYIRSASIVEALFRRIDEECSELRLDLAAAERIGESLGFTDKIISRGEILSSRFVAALLQDRGISSEFVDLSDIVESKVTRGLDQHFYQRLAIALSERVKACGDHVPVLTGYWGSVPGEPAPFNSST